MALSCGQGRTPRFGMTTWLALAFVTGVIVLADVPANGGEPMSLAEAIRLLYRGTPETPGWKTPPQPVETTPGPGAADLLAIQHRLDDPNLTKEERRALLEQLTAGLGKAAEDEKWRDWRELIQDAEQSAAAPLSSVDELLTLQNTLQKDQGLSSEDEQRIMRRVKDLLQMIADQDTRRRWDEVAQTDHVAQARAKLAQILDYYAMLTLFQENEQRMASQWRDDPHVGAWTQFAKTCRELCHQLDVDDVQHSGPLLLRLRLLEGLAHLQASVLYQQAQDVERQLLHYHRGINLVELVLRVGPDRFPSPPVIPDRLDSAIGNAGLIHEDKGGNSQPVSVRTKAQHVMTDFCPWGVRIYELLRDAGLTAGLDWRILPPYGGEDIVEVGPVTVLAPDIAPAPVCRFARDVGMGWVSYAKELDLKWVSPPKLTCSICWLSEEAFAWKLSDTVVAMWKAFVFVKAGPLPLIEDALQDYAVSELGKLGKDTGLYGTVGVVHDLDNWGFDKSWIWKAKAEVKPGKFTKSFLVHLLQMNEGDALKRLFSGDVPEFDVLRGRTLDARTYNGRPVPLVILRADIHGLVQVPSDQYPCAWTFTKHYVLAPQNVAGVEPAYNLRDEPVAFLKHHGKYLAGDEKTQELLWNDVPVPDTQFCVRRSVTDFAPIVQVIRCELPRAAVEAWRDSAKDDETVVALLRHASGGKAVAGSVLQVGGTRLSWRLEDKRRRAIIDDRSFCPQPGQPIALVDYAQWKVDMVCEVDVPRKSYLVDIVKCKTGENGPKWEEPLERLARSSVQLVDTPKNEGTVTEFAPGCVQIERDIKAEFKSDKRKPTIIFRRLRPLIDNFADIVFSWESLDDDAAECYAPKPLKIKPGQKINLHLEYMVFATPGSRISFRILTGIIGWRHWTGTSEEKPGPLELQPLVKQVRMGDRETQRTVRVSLPLRIPYPIRKEREKIASDSPHDLRVDVFANNKKLYSMKIIDALDVPGPGTDFNGTGDLDVCVLEPNGKDGYPGKTKVIVTGASSVTKTFFGMTCWLKLDGPADFENLRLGTYKVRAVVLDDRDYYEGPRSGTATVTLFRWNPRDRHVTPHFYAEIILGKGSKKPAFIDAFKTESKKRPPVTREWYIHVKLVDKKKKGISGARVFTAKGAMAATDKGQGRYLIGPIKNVQNLSSRTIGIVADIASHSPLSSPSMKPQFRPVELKDKQHVYVTIQFDITTPPAFIGASGVGSGDIKGALRGCDECIRKICTMCTELLFCKSIDKKCMSCIERNEQRIQRCMEGYKDY